MLVQSCLVSDFKSVIKFSPVDCFYIAKPNQTLEVTHILIEPDRKIMCIPD